MSSTISADPLATQGRLPRGVLVTNIGFAKTARLAAPDGGPIELLTMAGLEHEVLNVSNSARHFIEGYQNTEIFDTFIEIGAQYRNTIQPGYHKPIPNATQQIISWLSERDNLALFILGDFGTGKTTLLNRLKYILFDDYVEQRVQLRPLLILLKEYQQWGDLDALVRHSLTREYEREIPLPLFWRAVDEGQIVVLLDGFDEMAAGSDASSRAKDFLRLSRFYSPKSKTILTCRPAYFVSSDEYNKLIGNIQTKEKQLLSIDTSSEVEHSTSTTAQEKRRFRKHKDDISSLIGVLNKNVANTPRRTLLIDQSTETIELDSFSEADIAEFLRRHDEDFKQRCDCRWKDVLRFLLKVYDLKDLMTRPILLRMITDTVLHKAIDPKDEHVKIGPAGLYKAYTGMKLVIETAKGETRELLTSDERRVFAISIAIAMFRNRKLEVTFEEITELVGQTTLEVKEMVDLLNNLTPEQITADVQTCTFLGRFNDQHFRFIHKSFMEYFVAEYIFDQVQRNQKEHFLAQPLPKEILYFLGSITAAELGGKTRIRELYSHAKDPVPRKNLASALLYSGPEQRKLKIIDTVVDAIEVSRNKFIENKWRNVRFSNVAMSDNEISKSVLEDVRFSQCFPENLRILNSEVDFQLESSTLQQLRIENSESSWRLANGRINDGFVKGGVTRIQGSGNILGSKFNDGTVRVHNGTLRIEAKIDGGSLEIDKCEVSFEKEQLRGVRIRIDRSTLITPLKTRGQRSSLMECKIESSGICRFEEISWKGCDFTIVGGSSVLDGWYERTRFFVRSGELMVTGLKQPKKQRPDRKEKEYILPSCVYGKVEGGTVSFIEAADLRNIEHITGSLILRSGTFELRECQIQGALKLTECGCSVYASEFAEAGIELMESSLAESDSCCVVRDCSLTMEGSSTVSFTKLLNCRTKVRSGNAELSCSYIGGTIDVEQGSRVIMTCGAVESTDIVVNDRLTIREAKIVKGTIRFRRNGVLSLDQVEARNCSFLSSGDMKTASLELSGARMEECSFSCVSTDRKAIVATLKNFVKCKGLFFLRDGKEAGSRGRKGFTEFKPGLYGASLQWLNTLEGDYSEVEKRISSGLDGKLTAEILRGLERFSKLAAGDGE